MKRPDIEKMLFKDEIINKLALAEYIEYLEMRTALLVSWDVPENDKDKIDYYSHRAQYYNELLHFELDKNQKLEKENKSLKNDNRWLIHDLKKVKALQDKFLKVVDSVLENNWKDYMYGMLSKDKLIQEIKKELEKNEK